MTFSGVNSQMRLTRRLASRRLSNSAIQAENCEQKINTFLQKIVQKRTTLQDNLIRSLVSIT